MNKQATKWMQHLHKHKVQLQHQLDKVEDAMVSLSALVKGTKVGVSTFIHGPKKKKRKLSKEGRLAISRAAKARWAKEKAEKK